eukprot:2230529-Rhodomonas_salina.2
MPPLRQDSDTSSHTAACVAPYAASVPRYVVASVPGPIVLRRQPYASGARDLEGGSRDLKREKGGGA